VQDRTTGRRAVRPGRWRWAARKASHVLDRPELARLRGWASSVAGAARGAGEGAPHYVRDYRAWVRGALDRESSDEQALRLAIGDPLNAMGPVQRAIVVKAGLLPGHTMVDVGCGIGQLAAAVEGYLRDGSYLGTDVVPECVAYAAGRVSSPRFRFAVVESLDIPAADASVDMVTMFSVLTHLHQAESFRLLREAARVLRPGGTIVATFLEFAHDDHWPHFDLYVNADHPPHLNALIERNVFDVWAAHLGLHAEIVPADTHWTDEHPLGQSIAILRKPAA
jgi:SAM-dependent methyltransferase